MTIPPLHKFPALSTLLCFVIHLAKLHPYLNPNLHTLCSWMGLEEIPKPHWLVLFIPDHKSPVSTFCALSLIWSVSHSWLYTFSLHGPPAPPLQPLPVPDKAYHFIVKLEAIRIKVPQHASQLGLLSSLYTFLPTSLVSYCLTWFWTPWPLIYLRTPLPTILSSLSKVSTESLLWVFKQLPRLPTSISHFGWHWG